MPSLDLSQNILSLGAEAQYGDAASARASASVDIKAKGEVRHGLRVELGVQGVAAFKAAWEKFVTAGVQVDGHASAEVEARIQKPLDLFSESGAVVDLRAAAQAGIRARVALGLSLGDFVELALRDQRMEGIWIELFRVFLEEVQIVAGLRANVAFSAMAFANLGITGRLVADENGDPGFTVAADMGYGLEGGGGVQVFGELGLKDSRRWVSRSVDLIVEDVIERICGVVDDRETQRMVRAFRTPARIALRSAFEMGLELANSAETAFGDNGEAASRAVTVTLEECQRFLLEAFVSAGVSAVRSLMEEMGVLDSDGWADSVERREELAALLTNMPEDPFEFRLETALYWADVVNTTANLAADLGGGLVPEEWKQPIALMWSGTQLLFVGVRRVVSGGAHASLFGVVGVSATTETQEAFSGPLPDHGSMSDAADVAGVGGNAIDEELEVPAAPAFIAEVINETIGKPHDHDPQQQDLIEFLVQSGLDVITEEMPESKAIIGIIVGHDSGGEPSAQHLAVGLSRILNNIGAFMPKNGVLDAQESLKEIAKGFSAYLQSRVNVELRPQLAAVLETDHPDLWLMIDEVLLESTEFMANVAMKEAIEWSFGGRDALREACSAILMKLTTRTLVVTQDILIDHILQTSSGTFQYMADNLETPGSLQHLATFGGLVPVDIGDDSIVDALENVTNEPLSEPIKEILRATLEVVAEVTAPLPKASRQKIRQKLYVILDPYQGAPDDFLSNLNAADPFTSENAMSALVEVASEVGAILGDRFLHFFMLFLGKAAEIIQKEFEAFFQSVEDAITNEYLPAIDESLDAVAQDLRDLPGEVARKFAEMTAAGVTSIEAVEDLLNLLDSEEGRAKLVEQVAKFVVEESGIGPLGRRVADILAMVGLAPLKPIPVSQVSDAISSTLEEQGVAALIEQLAPLRSEANAILEDIREILEPASQELAEIDYDGDVVAQIKEIVIDAVVAKLQGTGALTIPGITVPQNSIPGWNHAEFTIGQVVITTQMLTSLIETAAGPLEWLENFIEDDLADALEGLIVAEDAHAEAQQSLVEAETLSKELERQKEESLVSDIDIEILSPRSLSTHGPDLEIEILAKGLPTSFLGLGEPEGRRCFVMINERRIPMGEFQIDDLTVPMTVGTGVAASVMEAPAGAAIVRGVGGAGAGAGLSAGGSGERGVVRETLKPAMASAAPWGLNPTRHGERVEITTVSRPGPGMVRGVDGQSTLREQLSLRRARRVAERAHHIGSTRSHSFESRGNTRRVKPEKARIAKVPIGRAHVLKPWERKLVLQQVGRGLILSTTVGSRQLGLRDGLNTLTVFVTNGRGLTIKHTVPFLFEEGPVRARPEVEVPTVPDPWRYEDLPEVLQGLVGVGAGIAARVRPEREITPEEPVEIRPRKLWLAAPAARAELREISSRHEKQELADSTRLLDAVAKTVRRGGLRKRRAQARRLVRVSTRNRQRLRWEVPRGTQGARGTGRGGRGAGGHGVMETN